MRSPLLFVSLGVLSLFGMGLTACATAVAPSAAEAEGKANDTDASTTGPTDYTSGGGNDDAGGGNDDAGTGKPNPKGDSGTSSGGGGGCAFTGDLATFDFTGESGSQSSTIATSKATGVTAGDVKRASGLTAVSGSDSMNASGWATATHVDTAKYFTVSVTPPSGCSLDITTISINTSTSGSGPTKGAVATSDDTFAAQSTFNAGSSANVKVSVSGATSATEIRIYGYGASSAGGTMRLQSTLTVTGALK
ncbi:MAG: hypothetical protein ABI461_15840 [Polyangiaceae bacterium]